MTPSLASNAPHLPLPRIRRVAPARIAHWLAAGWRDLKRTPVASLAYGLLFAMAGDLLLIALWQDAHRVVLAISGFCLVAPLLCAGLYELSRRSERGLDSRFVDSGAAFVRGAEGLALCGLGLFLFWLAWERLSAILLASLLPAGGGVAELIAVIALETRAALFAAGWFAAGAVIAGIVFALTVVSVPLLIDRDSDLLSAAHASLRAIAANPLALLLWAATLAGLTLLGFATLLFGLVLIMPLLGHASWHAYRDLVE